MLHFFASALISQSCEFVPHSFTPALGLRNQSFRDVLSRASRSQSPKSILSRVSRFRVHKSSQHSRSMLVHLGSSKTSSRRSHPAPRKSPNPRTFLVFKSLTPSQAFRSSQPTRPNLSKFLQTSLICKLLAPKEVSCCSMLSSSKFDQLRHRSHFQTPALTIFQRSFSEFSTPQISTACSSTASVAGPQIAFRMLNDDLFSSKL